jgi:ATPase family AAA domain-containing protein 3A/B
MENIVSLFGLICLYFREQLKKQEEIAARQEEMRRKTAEYEAELRTKTEIAKARAETEGRIAQERQNHDLILEKVRLEAKEHRDTVLQAITDGGKILGEGISSYLEDTEKLRNTALTITGIAVGVYTARTSIGVAGRFVEARLGKPSLVRETSRLSAGHFLRQPLASTQRLFRMGRKESDALKGIVLENSLDTQLRKIAVSTANTKKNRAPFRHLLLHGTLRLSLAPSNSEVFSQFLLIRSSGNWKDNVCAQLSRVFWFRLCHLDGW